MNPNVAVATYPIQSLRSNSQQLIWQMIKRDVIGRYRGSFLGLA